MVASFLSRFIISTCPVTLFFVAPVPNGVYSVTSLSNSCIWLKDRYSFCFSSSCINLRLIHDITILFVYYAWLVIANALIYIIWGVAGIDVTFLVICVVFIGWLFFRRFRWMQGKALNLSYHPLLDKQPKPVAQRLMSMVWLARVKGSARFHVFV